MGDIRRYTLVHSESGSGMDYDPDGAYVRFDDHEEAVSEGFAAGLEAAAEMSEKEAEVSNRIISNHAPFTAGGDGQRELEMGARSAAKYLAVIFRQRAEQEKGTSGKTIEREE